MQISIQKSARQKLKREYSSTVKKQPFLFFAGMACLCVIEAGCDKADEHLFNNIAGASAGWASQFIECRRGRLGGNVNRDTTL
jgi:hypothetical protein